MSALLEHTTVTLMPTVPTLRDHSTARVILDTLETESRVKVAILSDKVSQVWMCHCVGVNVIYSFLFRHQ